MYQKDYCFAGLGVRMLSDVPPVEDENTVAFRQTGEKINSTCRIACVQQLPQVHGTQLMQTNELRLFRSGDTLYQQLLSPLDGHPLTVSVYDAVKQGEVSLYLSQADMPYIARSVHLWAGMDINQVAAASPCRHAQRVCAHGTGRYFVRGALRCGKVHAGKAVARASTGRNSQWR